MIGIILNIIGILLVVLSLVYIKRIYKRELDIYEEMLEIEYSIKNYSLAAKDVLNDFDELLGQSLDKLDSISEQQNRSKFKKEIKEDIIETNSLNNESDSEKNKILFYNTNNNGKLLKDNYNKIIELKEIGLSSKEIAKKLNIGIREVDVFLRISNAR